MPVESFHQFFLQPKFIQSLADSEPLVWHIGSWQLFRKPNDSAVLKDYGNAGEKVIIEAVAESRRMIVVPLC